MKKDNWIVKAFLMTFFIALIFSTISNLIVNKSNWLSLILLSIVFIIIGIIFDIIGTAILSCNEASFHAKNSRKIKGSKESIYLIKNSEKITSICNDVIGDICGIVSGSIGAILSIKISSITGFSLVVVTLIISSLISSLTVGGKAIGKRYAINNADDIIYNVGKLLNMFKKDSK